MSVTLVSMSAFMVTGCTMAYMHMVIFEGLSEAGLVAIYQYIDAKYHHIWDHLHHQLYQCILQHSPKCVKEGFSGRRLSLRKPNNKVESTENRIY